ncbi:hypothetical protein KM043_014576 [Ampulex compressa]|nr:hypothetical protein KM043_014576 [Ampulex compressa]
MDKRQDPQRASNSITSSRTLNKGMKTEQMAWTQRANRWKNPIRIWAVVWDKTHSASMSADNHWLAH